MAAKLLCGSKARTNFPNDSHSSASSANLLSATLTEKLQKCHTASLQVAKKAPSSSRPASEEGIQWDEMKWESSSSNSSEQFYRPLEDDHIDQMIAELLDYGSVELVSALQI